MILFLFNAIIIAAVIVVVGWAVQYLYEQWQVDSEWRKLPNVEPCDELPEDDRLFTESRFGNPLYSGDRNRDRDSERSND